MTCALPHSGPALVEADILNPRYPEYYRTAGDEPPSDDQDPSPVYFLAVRAGVRFEFRWRLCPREGEATAAMTDEEIPERVGAWLREALATWGAGAKTAAGYGYFETGVDPVGDDGDEDGAVEQEHREVWEGARVEWTRADKTLTAHAAGRVARGDQAQLDRLPQHLRDRLTGGPKREGEKRKKGKSVTLDVEVLVKGPTYIEIVGFPGVEGE